MKWIARLDTREEDNASEMYLKWFQTVKFYLQFILEINGCSMCLREIVYLVIYTSNMIRKLSN